MFADWKPVRVAHVAVAHRREIGQMTTKLLGIFAAAGAAALIVAGGFSGSTLAQSDNAAAAIKQRQEAMKTNGKDAKLITEFVKKGEGSAAAAAAAATKTASIAEKIPELFPKGTDEDSAVGKAGKTRAKAVIWTQWDKFQADAAALKTKSEAMAKAINGGDKTEMAAALKDMDGACGACHKTFRAAKKK
jgi:cytochrome c556